MKAPIRAVFFDAAGTLLTPTPSVGTVYAAIARSYGVVISDAAAQRAFLAQWKRRTAPGALPPFDQPDAVQYEWWREVVEAVFRDTCHLSGFGSRFSEFFDELYERFAHPDVWRIFDDVEPTLRVLREQNLRVAVISNWDNRLPRLIAATPLAPYFDFVLTSACAGSSKPSPAIFRHALERSGVEAAAAVHVGDSPVDDLEGATRAGLTGLLLDRCAATSSGRMLATLAHLPAVLL
jgi:putative hydrolase of the HAD superfamily